MTDTPQLTPERIAAVVPSIDDITVAAELRFPGKGYAHDRMAFRLGADWCAKQAAARLSPTDTPEAEHASNGVRQATELRRVAAILASERIQGWANPLVSTLTDIADALDGPVRTDTGEAILTAKGPVNCNVVLRHQHKAMPRTCERCGLGPCPFYHNSGEPK